MIAILVWLACDVVLLLLVVWIWRGRSRKGRCLAVPVSARSSPVRWAGCATSRGIRFQGFDRRRGEATREERWWVTGAA